MLEALGSQIQLRQERPGLGDTAQARGDGGTVCVWFAASEHCGIPRAPSGLLGSEEAGVSRAGTRLGAGPALGSPAPAESRGGRGCSSAHPSISSLFFPVLNSFLTFSMPWLLLLLLLCVCVSQESSAGSSLGA